MCSRPRRRKRRRRPRATQCTSGEAGRARIRLSPLEIRILNILKDWYPITVEELRDELSLRPTELDRALKSLMVKGIIMLEPLSDKSYVRLLTPDIEVETVGGKRKKSRQTRPELSREDESIMYR